ncbi:hypothetical protein C3920_01985 [Novacetimonas pomaceti]|uniref:Uncharacterized protein n=1 Tax=Novacetimonas pomaceti TaxID=2021998 RepID=A0ABX5PA69_9PROT|nr:hypothetical protein C3920_01985 [Novacetimonas pomaceti]
MSPRADPHGAAFSRPTAPVQKADTGTSVSRPAEQPAATAASSENGQPVEMAIAEEWSPVPKARLDPRERPRPGDLSFFFQGMRENRDEKKFFPVASTRSVRSNVSRVTSMTKTNTNPQPSNPPASTDGSPTMTEVFLTLGGRATEFLNPRPSLRDALLRRRENSEENS